MKPQKELSPFVQTAIAFDSDVAELERLSRQIEAASLDKENEFNRVQKLMKHFTECGFRVTQGLRTLSKEFESTRERAERATQSVSSRAGDVQQKQDHSQALMEKFVSLGARAREISGKVTEMQSEEHPEERRKIIFNYLPELNSKISALLQETLQLKDQARNENLKEIERNAEALSHNLAIAQNKLRTISPTDQDSGHFHIA